MAAVCANGHVVPTGEKTCEICGAPAITKGSAMRNAIIAGLVLLAVIGAVIGIRHLIHRNDPIEAAPPAQIETVVEQTEATAAPGETTAPAEPTAPTAQPAHVEGNILRDDPGVLTARASDVNAELAQLQSETGLRMYVMYVNSFDGQTGVDWSRAAATEAGLGNDDILLAVAVQDRLYGFSYGSGVHLTDSQWNAVENATRSALGAAVNAPGGQGDWAAATIDTADAIIQQAG